MLVASGIKLNGVQSVTPCVLFMNLRATRGMGPVYKWNRRQEEAMSMIEESVPHSAPSKPLSTPRRTSEENTMLNPNSVASPATLSTTAGAAHVRFPHFSLRISERRLVLLAVDVILINVALLLAVVISANFVPSVDNILAVSKWF